MTPSITSASSSASGGRSHFNALLYSYLLYPSSRWSLPAPAEAARILKKNYTCRDTSKKKFFFRHEQNLKFTDVFNWKKSASMVVKLSRVVLSDVILLILLSSGSRSFFIEVCFWNPRFLPRVSLQN